MTLWSNGGKASDVLLLACVETSNQYGAAAKPMLGRTTTREGWWAPGGALMRLYLPKKRGRSGVSLAQAPHTHLPHEEHL